jgi:phage terminase large subunit
MCMREQVCQPLIPLISLEEFEKLTPVSQSQYLRLYREQVAPAFEAWRKPARYKFAYGGRGAGAKSWSAAKLLLERAEVESIRVLCVRDVQKSIKESSWLLLRDTLVRLGYKGWIITNTYIKNTKNGSYFIFNGLNDITAADLKSYESFDVLFAEEAAPISKDSWLTIDATFRKKGSEIWGLFNRTLELDPCYELFCLKKRLNSIILDLRPGPLDNPWWFSTELPAQWKFYKENFPDEHEHMFMGNPRAQGNAAIFARARVRAMEDREAKAEGATGIGCDVARFGPDSTEAYKHKGMCVIAHKYLKKADTNEIASMLWDMADRDNTIPIKVDSGYNPGVIDVLRKKGANVIEVGFGEVASDKDKYPNAISEMFFEFPVDEVSIPKEFMTTTLFADLTERLYKYDKVDRRMVEEKAAFKKRHGGRSPDEGDALLLCFYNRAVNSGVAETLDVM